MSDAVSTRGLISVREAAERAHMSVSTVRRWLRAREPYQSDLVVRITARKWWVNLEKLKTLLALEHEETTGKLTRHGRRLDELDRRLEAVEKRR